LIFLLDLAHIALASLESKQNKQALVDQLSKVVYMYFMSSEIKAKFSQKLHHANTDIYLKICLLVKLYDSKTTLPEISNNFHQMCEIHGGLNLKPNPTMLNKKHVKVK